MDFYIPPIFVVVGGIATAGVIASMRIPLSVIGGLAVILLAYTLYLHIQIYSIEYRSYTLGDGLKSAAPTILIGAIIVMSIGYLLMLRGGSKSSSTYMPAAPSFFSQMSQSPSPASSSRPGNFTSSERRNYISALNRLI
jgi:hypothetical protein